MNVLQPFPRTSPESVGIPSAAIGAFLNQCKEKKIELHSLMILRHGKVCAEGWWKPYSADRIHNIFSFTKTFVGSAIGILLSEGKLSLEDSVLSLFPEDAPDHPGENLKKMKLRHLLSMSTGHHKEPAVSKAANLPQAFLAAPVEHEPGSWFVYNSAASEMLGRLVEKITGQTFLEFLETRLFQPMGFGEKACFLSADGSPSAGGGMALTAEDMCRLAQLYLNLGEWNGQQILPREWVATATLPQCDNSNGIHQDGNEDWEAGYGYQMWMNAPLHSYRFDGAFGQEAIVCPEQDLVVVFNAATTNLADILRDLWRFLLANVSDGPLPKNPGAATALKERLANLTLPELCCDGVSLLQEAVSGKKISLPANHLYPIFTEGYEQIPMDVSGIIGMTPVFATDSMTLLIQTAENSYELLAGMDGAVRRNCINVNGKEIELYASAKWLDQNQLSITWRSLQIIRASSLEITYHLNEAEVRIIHDLRGVDVTLSGRYE